MLQDQIIESILTQLASDGVFDPKKREEAFKSIQKATNGKIFTIWSIEDIHIFCEKEGFSISDQKAFDVLYNLKKNEDHEYGITWDHIKQEIENVLKMPENYIEFP